MLMEKGTAFVRMALKAGCLLKSSQSFPKRGFVGIVAGYTGKDPFLKTVLLVQIELGHHIAVAKAATGLAMVIIGSRRA